MFDCRLLVVATGCALVASTPVTARAADPVEEQGAERCISLNRISSTEVLDDHTIVFYMRGGEVYRNDLPHRCPGLRRQQPFMYRTSLSQLCDLDVVTVLLDHGFGFTPGASCGLGRFYATTKDEIKALKEAPRKIEPEKVPTAEPEEFGEP